ncbi:lipoate--protein ligase [Shouchella lonarensis]|uniref:lipoate--protein ligase n=1 Tax=Shouchella lonarensis TaxID=1464122 RepID=A0A1G6JL26_9BACI|nr:lipoate--protein ligase [Shouchella lonarensis]SDC18656.1 lipoate-protein ligase [Shouchella lonarensis]
MKFIDNEQITDPRINLAVEEWALKHLDEDETYLLFYINEPSIIIGKNQNTFEEINLDYVKENGIHVVRRLSGGGAVYHDLGNLNFSFITKDDGASFNDFKKFTEPVVRALAELGVDAKLTGRNDIQVGERKISGNAQFTTKGRMFSHGTLLFNSEIEHVVSALNVKDEKIRSKGIKSIRSRVANIAEFLAEPMSMADFKAHLLKHIFHTNETIPAYKLSQQDWADIHSLSEARYKNWDWNFGKSPTFDIQRAKRFPIGTIDVRLNVRKGVITSCKIYGDFFGTQDVAELADVLIGTRYAFEPLQQVLAPVDLQGYFGTIDADDFLQLLYA